MSDLVQSSRKRTLKFATLLGAATLGLAACATPNGPNHASSNCVGVASTVRDATVASYRHVNIQGDDQGIGTISGAALGGLAGSQLGGRGRGTATAAGAIAGALLGGLAGNAVGDAVTSGDGTAYILRFQNGETREIIQGGTSAIAPGTPVFVTFRCNGAVITPAA